MALLHPITIFMMFAFNHHWPVDLTSWYKKYFTSMDFVRYSGPLWFALALLIFSMIYVLLRVVFLKSKFVVFGIVLWGMLMIFGGSLKDWTPFSGGFHWQAAAYAVWESFFCIGICLGLVGFISR